MMSRSGSMTMGLCTVLLLVATLTEGAVLQQDRNRLILGGGAGNFFQQTRYNNTSGESGNSPLEICDDCVCGMGRNSRIVNGKITNTWEFPWAVVITYQGMHQCGASMITRKHILTAAHCIYGFQKKYFGVKLPNAGEKYRIRRMIMHRDYDHPSFNNDIAVIELDRPVAKNEFVGTACLPETASFDRSGEVGTAIGWGRIGEGLELSEDLRKVDLPVLSKEECQQSEYPKDRITDNMFCAGYLAGTYDSCSGDSGGAFHLRSDRGAMEVAGIVSFGRGCARPNFPGVYTKVSNYLDWIADRVKGSCVCPQPSLSWARNEAV